MINKGIDVSNFRAAILDRGCNHEGFPQFSLGAIDVPPTVNFELLNKVIDQYDEIGLDFAFPVWNERNDN